MAAERFYWFFLNHVPQLGPLRFQRLLQAAGSAEAIMQMNVLQLMNAEIPESLAQLWHKAIRDGRLWNQAEAEWAQADKGEFRIVCEVDPDYPESLRELIGRPPVLYIRGLWPIPQRLALGLVGTRRMTPYGEAVARQFTEDLTAVGVVTVSGLAAGIDTVVHETTLNKEGHSVAALGHGFKYLFPASNKGLFKRMAEKGTLITEFPFDTPPDAQHFPRRNRIISGLSRGVVVIEAALQSGALITARYAVEQGRDVFAVPGNVLRGSNAGCHQLLQNGARLVESVADILDEYQTVPKSKEAQRDFEEIVLEGLEKKIMECLSNEPISVDDLTQILGRPVDQLAGTLLSLELKGYIQHLPGQQYVTNH